jgi:hypothetical protein
MEEIEVPRNSVLGILDQSLREARLIPEYTVQSFIDEKSKKVERGILLENVKGAKIDMLQKFAVGNLHKLGILGFVNGKEPEQGALPLDVVVPKQGDLLSLALIEQGKYKGDFSLENKQVEGLQHLFSHRVTASDLKNSQKIKLDIMK